jgi:hypothetical protein
MLTFLGYPQQFGSSAIFTAIRRASSRASKWSQSRPCFFNDRYAAALPTIAPFFFESETAGLTFDRHRWLQDFRC